VVIVNLGGAYQLLFGWFSVT